MARSVAQVIECLPTKTLRSNPGTAKKPKITVRLCEGIIMYVSTCVCSSVCFFEVEQGYLQSKLGAGYCILWLFSLLQFSCPHLGLAISFTTCFYRHFLSSPFCFVGNNFSLCSHLRDHCTMYNRHEQMGDLHVDLGWAYDTPMHS
jgi:hypothetical protein